MSNLNVAFQGPQEVDSTGVVGFFRVAAVENPSKSKEEGVPVFENVEQVVLMLPKDNKTRPVFEASKKYQERFPEAWRLFKDRVQDASTGTPLTSLAALTPADLATLSACRIMNVEQLAALDPSSGDKRFGARLSAMVHAAQKYMRSTTENDAIGGLKDENEQLKARLAALEAKLNGAAESKRAATASKKTANRKMVGEDEGAA